ncbi:MAG: transglutaminaseTgpA domain-containing protein [Trueperaceae bacterium]
MNTNTMKAKDLVAYALIIVGLVALLGRISGGAGWLWVALVAVGFLWAYVAQKSYGLLVTGCILAGIAVGLLLEATWGWNGAFLISLGIGFIMIDRIETRQNKWPFYIGAILAVLGFIIGILETGFLGSFWFALILIGVGVYLLTRGQGADPNAGWVKVKGPNSPNPSDSTAPVSTSNDSTASTTTPASSSFVNSTEASATAQDISSSHETVPSEIATTSETTSADKTTTASEAVTSSSVSDVSRASSSSISIVTNDGNTNDGKPILRETLPLEYDQDLYNKLETWRRETAKQEDRAAYLILTNDTMQKIATLKPQTVQELLDIKGIGEVKLERYGEALLKIIKS